MTNLYLDAALAAYAAGLAVLPPEEDGSKKPMGGWSRFQDHRPSLGRIRVWYRNGRTGLGAVMGAVSGNLELFEFDDFATYRAFKVAAEAAGLGALVERVERGYSERTPGGGVHWYTRCTEIAGNTKLARRPKRPEEMRDPEDRWKTLIETRGEGGYAVMAPSAGRVHQSGQPYVCLQGTPASIVAITPEERAELWRLARTFDETPETTPREPAGLPSVPGGRPGDDYAERTSWHDLLIPRGWVAVYQRNEVTYWRRPGKDSGVSATTNYHGSGLLYVFSTSTAFESERGYSKFSAYALLEHGGDFSAAAGKLREEGYGGKGTVIDLSDPDDGIDTETGEVVDDRPRWNLITGRQLRQMELPPITWLWEHTIPRGRYVVLSGDSGLGKSWFALALALSCEEGGSFLGRAADGGRAIYIDEENGAQEAQRRLRALADGMGIPQDTELPVDFLIDEGVKFDKRPKLDALIEMVLEHNITTIITDSLIRFFDGNENNSNEVKAFHAAVDYVRRKTGATWIMLQHLNKAGRDGATIAPGDRIRGSGEFKAHADVHIQLRGGDDTGVVIVHVEKLRGGMKPSDIAYRLNGDTRLEEPVTVTLLGSTAEALGAVRGAAIEACNVLEEAGVLAVMDVVDLMIKRGVPERTARRGLADARKAGYIIDDHKEGKYVFVRLRTEADR